MGSSFRLAGPVTPVMSGVREVLKSDGVASMLRSQADKAASRCNSMFSLHRVGHLKKPPYASKVTLGSYTAVGVVHVNSKLGKIDNLSHNTLKKGCGV